MSWWEILGRAIPDMRPALYTFDLVNLGLYLGALLAIITRLSPRLPTLRERFNDPNNTHSYPCLIARKIRLGSHHCGALSILRSYTPIVRICMTPLATREASLDSHTILQ